MSITPVGGWNGPEGQLRRRPFQDVQIQQGQPQEGHILPNTSDTCPSCFGTEWKAASLLYAEGLSVTGSKTKGGFVAVGRSGQHWQAGGGAYSGRTRGVSQTLLSAKATPPKANNLYKFFGFVFVALLVACLLNLGSEPVTPIILAILSGCSLWMSIMMRQQERARFKRATESYASLRMCTRCGTFFNG